MKLKILIGAGLVGVVGLCFVLFQARAEPSKCERILERVVKQSCSDADEPWAAVHGALAFGKDFKSSKGVSAIEASVLTHAKFKDGRVTFEAFNSEGEPVEPHPGLFAKVALELGHKMDSEALKKKGLSAEKLAKDSLYALDMSKSLHNQEWMLEILFRVGSETQKKEAAEKALALLEAEQKYMEPMLADWEKSVQSFVKKARRVKGRPMPEAIHRYFCGGTHLFHAVTLAISKGLLGDAGKSRYAKQMQILLFRAQAESSYWNRQMTKVYGASMGEKQKRYLIDLFYTQKLKILGHAVESWHKARLWKAYKASEKDKKIMAVVVKDLESTVESIDRRGLY
ncbi:MAG: hypothetical protein P1V97_20020, partial [Planctomycetota bacterium]|nr:hypothetical protein [Planctomycetota bacterium]